MLGLLEPKPFFVKCESESAKNRFRQEPQPHKKILSRKKDSAPQDWNKQCINSRTEFGVKVSWNGALVLDCVIPEHFPEVCQEELDGAVLLRGLLRQPLFDHVQSYRLLEIIKLIMKLQKVLKSTPFCFFILNNGKLCIKMLIYWLNKSIQLFTLIFSRYWGNFRSAQSLHCTILNHLKKLEKLNISSLKP